MTIDTNNILTGHYSSNLTNDTTSNIITSYSTCGITTTSGGAGSNSNTFTGIYGSGAAITITAGTGINSNYWVNTPYTINTNIGFIDISSCPILYCHSKLIPGKLYKTCGDFQATMCDFNEDKTNLFYSKNISYNSKMPLIFIK